MLRELVGRGDKDRYLLSKENAQNTYFIDPKYLFISYYANLQNTRVFVNSVTNTQLKF